MPMLDCLMCDKLFYSVRGASKYCEDCKIKQRDMKMRDTALKNKKFTRLKIQKVVEITRTCPVCNKAFQTLLRIHGPEKTYCSVACRKSFDARISTGLATMNLRKRKKKALVPPSPPSDAV